MQLATKLDYALTETTPPGLAVGEDANLDQDAGHSAPDCLVLCGHAGQAQDKAACFAFVGRQPASALPDDAPLRSLKVIGK